MISRKRCGAGGTYGVVDSCAECREWNAKETREAEGSRGGERADGLGFHVGELETATSRAIAK